MAFINALSAAGVASFIARACRDGQLASCGCSRSSRPNQLNKDWTWGGCGDDLEFGYKWVSSTWIYIITVFVAVVEIHEWVVNQKQDEEKAALP